MSVTGTLGVGTILLICLVGPQLAQADGWAYAYDDDFTTPKAATDSYDHSAFWEPGVVYQLGYLSYTAQDGNPPPALRFNPGFMVGSSAHLGYCFPLPGAAGPNSIFGALDIDVFLSAGGYLAYSVSPDGDFWTLPMPLGSGHHHLALGSGQGTCYVMFTGVDVGIDNLSVSLTPEPATLSLLGAGGLALLRRKRGYGR